MKEKSKISQLMPYIRPYTWQLVVATIGLLITSFTVLGIPAGFRYVVDEGLSKGNEALLDKGLLCLIVIVAVMSVSTFCRFFFMTWAGEKIVADIRRDVYKHILKLSPEFFESQRSGDLLSRLTSDVSIIQGVIGSSISVAARHTLTLIGGTVMLFVTSPKLAIYVFGVVPLVVFPILFLGRKVRVLSKQNQERVSDMAAHIEENIYGIKTVQSFLREARESQEFEDLNSKTLASAKERITMRAILTGLVIMLIFSAIAFVLWIGGKDVLQGKLSGGDLIAFLLYSVFVASAVGAISEVIADLQRASGAADRLLQILAVDSTIKDPVSPKHLNGSLKGALEFNNVDFSYPSAPDILALKNFNLKIQPGEKVAIVGPSGAGKSTVFELILRFYDVKSGGVKIDNVDVRELTLDELRGNIGIVNQDPVIFSTTAFENIEFGRGGATADEVKKAAEASASLEFINKLPNGFDTYLGEKGVRLSGGQKQRLAIARTILKNPRVLLLDEATSALDSENERLIQAAIEDLSKDRTTLIIAHRLSTITSADRIVVLNNGEIESVGTHKELLETSKLYKKLAELQFTD